MKDERNNAKKIVLIIILTITLVFSMIENVSAAEVNLMPPEEPVNLVWIHHSIGGYWAYLRGDAGGWNDGLGVEYLSNYHTRHGDHLYTGNGEVALYNSNYILHHQEYGSCVGQLTSFSNWYYKFLRFIDNTRPEYEPPIPQICGATNNPDMIHAYSQDIMYYERGTDYFTGENVTNHTNQIIMFKPGHANANVITDDGVPNINDYASTRAWLDSVNDSYMPYQGYGGPINKVQATYIGLLEIFETYPDILFVIWASTPPTDSSGSGPYVRPLYEWMQNELLQNYYWNGTDYTSYPLDNVMVFNAWNIMTGQRTETIYALNKHNHHRYSPFIGGMEFTTAGDPDYSDSVEKICPGDDHPYPLCHALVTKEFINQLNIQWNKMHNITYTGIVGYPQNGLVSFSQLDETDDRSKQGVTLQIVDDVYAHVFDGTVNAVLDLGNVDVGGGPFSYAYWYRPNVNSVPSQSQTAVLRKDGVFESTHFLFSPGGVGDIGYINTWFGGSYFQDIWPLSHANNVVDVDTWTHVAFVWNGSCFRHYVDGTQLLETECESRTIGISGNNLFLGGGTENLNGAIREVAVYNRSLSLEEIKAIFNANAASAPSEQNYSDVNNDNVVNIIDLTLVIFWQGKDNNDPDWGYFNHLDVNNDTVINFADVIAVISSFGQSF